MLIYKIHFSLLYFPYLFIFLWAWPKGACRMQIDRSTDKQTKSQTYAMNWRTEKPTRMQLVYAIRS